MQGMLAVKQRTIRRRDKKLVTTHRKALPHTAQTGGCVSRSSTASSVMARPARFAEEGTVEARGARAALNMA